MAPEETNVHGSRTAIALAGLLLMACAQFPGAATAPPPVKPDAGPFAAASTLPYELPRFADIKETDFAPALEAGMEEQRREVLAIAHDPAPATFENTLVALERSGRVLERVSKVFFNYTSSLSNPAIEKMQLDMAPRLAAHQDSIVLDAALFARIESLYRQRETLGLEPESRQLLERYTANFVHAGARLPEGDKERLRRFNQQSATLTTQFQQLVLKASEDGGVVVDRLAELDGLAPEQVSAAAAAAEARGLKGKWLIALQNTTIQPVLANLRNRALRERIYRASIGRGQGGPADTTGIIAELVRLRADRAALLGYPSFAAYALAEEGAATPAAVNAILAQIAPSALAAARREAAQVQHQIDMDAAGGKSFELQPWDWAFYSERVRKAQHGFDQDEVKPYLELDRVVKDGVFHAAHVLYGLDFRERPDLAAYAPMVRVFEVTDADGAPLALLLGDYFERDGKQGGAWESAYVSPSQLLGQKAVVSINLNIPQPKPGQPVLLTFDEVITLFHEMGHALHDIFSTARYPTLAGTNVPADFVEYPSQFNEMWVRDAAVVAHFARHYQTGEPMPRPLLDRMLAAQRYGEGYATLEYVAAAILDQAWHQISAGEVPPKEGVADFEAQAPHRAGMDFAPVPPRYHSTYFLHSFSGDAYAAGYYAYLWSEVLARDTGQWFTQRGGLTRSNGEAFRSKVLARGRTREPEVLFEDLVGKKPDVGPLLEYRGL